MEAQPLLEKAVKADPTFAMALAKLALVEGNLGHPLKREEYAKRALDQSERLSPRERYYIEGLYYSDKVETMGKAIEAYRKAVELYPDHVAAQHNLALLYDNLGREEDAIPIYEALRRRGNVPPVTFTNLAGIYRRLGQYDKAHEVLTEYVQANPDVPTGYRGLAGLLTVWGRWDEALAAFDKAQALEPANLTSLAGKAPIFIVNERWDEYSALNRKLLESTDPRWKYQGFFSQAVEQLYKGRSADAMRLLDSAATASGPRGSVQSANARVAIASLLLDRGQPATALAPAKRAVDDAGGVGAMSYFGLEVVARVHSRLGHKAEVTKAEEDLERMRRQLPSERLQRLTHHFHAGLLARDRRDADTAIAELKECETAARPGESNSGLFFELGSAYLDSGKDAQAATYFERIVNSAALRANDPLQFVRSLYFLGQINERKGDRAKAVEYYRRFVQYWGDGDMDRERVADVRKKLGS